MEFALVFPVLLLLILGFLFFIPYLRAQAAAQMAAYACAVFGAQVPVGAPDDQARTQAVQAAVQTLSGRWVGLPGTAFSGPEVLVWPDRVGCGVSFRQELPTAGFLRAAGLDLPQGGRFYYEAWREQYKSRWR